MAEDRPYEYEELYLSNIESQNIMAISEVETFTDNMRNNVIRSQDISSIIYRLKEYEEYFLFYNHISEHFAISERPKISQKLDEILCDIRNTINIFQQVYKKISDMTPDIDIIQDH